MHRYMFFFSDVNHHQHSGYDLGYSPTADSPRHRVKIAMRLPTHTRQVRHDVDLESTIAFSRRPVGERKQTYHFLRGAENLNAFGVSPSWISAQIVVLLSQSLAVASQKSVDKFEAELVQHSHLMKPGIPDILVATGA